VKSLLINAGLVTTRTVRRTNVQFSCWSQVEKAGIRRRQVRFAILARAIWARTGAKGEARLPLLVSTPRGVDVSGEYARGGFLHCIDVVGDVKSETTDTGCRQPMTTYQCGCMNMHNPCNRNLTFNVCSIPVFYSSFYPGREAETQVVMGNFHICCVAGAH
jgi:hypothetical protein